MRDCCQDAFGLLPVAPAATREKLVRIFGFVFRDGRSGKGCNRVRYEERPTEKADLALWMVLALKAYLVETGDASILDETVPFLDGGASTLYEHLLTAVQRVIDERGAHGLPLIHNGDWNDALDRIGDQGRGESVWLGQFLYYSLNELTDILAKKGDDERIAAYRAVACTLRENLEACHWDGAWFLRAFDDAGNNVGSSGDTEARIWLNTQTWAIIAGLGTDEQHQTCLGAVDRHLETPWGLTNLDPPYAAPDPQVGIISRFLPGHKENGAVFSHATAFHLIARALCGDAEGLYRIYRKSLPSERDQAAYKAEPYVYAQFCASPASARAGEGAYHWLTGTAAWMFRAVVDYMLGVRPTEDGLQVRPCVPPSFTAYRVCRRFRGVRYEIHVDNPDGLPRGHVELAVDGTPVDGDVIPLQPRDCRVDVRLHREQPTG